MVYFLTFEESTKASEPDKISHQQVWNTVMHGSTAVAFAWDISRCRELVHIFAEKLSSKFFQFCKIREKLENRVGWVGQVINKK